MPRKGKRRRIAPNVYADDRGLEVVARIGTKSKSGRLPKTASTAEIVAKYAALYAALAAQIANEPARPADKSAWNTEIERYKDRAAIDGLDSVVAHIRAWERAFPSKGRSQLTRDDVLRMRAQWKAAGVAPKTITNRISALRSMCHTLDGEEAPTPCDGVKALPSHKTPAVSVDVQTILAVDRELQAHEREGWLRSKKTRARFRVMASTGKRPSEVMRAKPADVDLRRRVWTVRDGKGGFSPGLYLTDDMLAAWALFIAADAWGDFDTYNMARVLRRCGWPANVRPYNLRHSVGIALSEAGIDLGDIQGFMGHKRIETTRKHYVPVRKSRMQKASDTIDGRLPWSDE